MGKPGVLFSVGCGGVYGLGHLNRCLAIAEAGRGEFDPFFHLAGGKTGGGTCGELLGDLPVVEAPGEGEFSLVCRDARETAVREMRSLGRTAPVLSLDDHGPGCRHAHLTLCTLPAPPGVECNLSGHDYIVVGRGARRAAAAKWRGDSSHRGRVVVSFGGSDPFNLTARVAGILADLGVRPLVIRGPFFSHPLREDACDVLDNPENMGEIVKHARLLVTSFGITLFEAFFLGTPVILYNHTRYHWQLSQPYPALNLGYGGDGREDDLPARLAAALEREDDLARNARVSREVVDGRGAERIARVIGSALSGGRRTCLLGHFDPEVFEREGDSSVIRCRTCGDLYLYRFGPSPGVSYDDPAYFLSEYRDHYGRTYEEDRDNIRRLARRRLDVIEGLKPRRGLLLDVGCALGFFMECARERGWEVRGVEVSPYAARYARDNLRLDVETGSFLEKDLPKATFDVVTLFYVAEHFHRVEEVIDKVRDLLKEGGLIVLALPNRGGISYRLGKSEYLDNRPGDHYFDTTPGNLSRFLRRRGFARRKILSTGIHPERFYRHIFKGTHVGRGAPFGLLYGVIARVLRLGDTFEYYGYKA